MILVTGGTGLVGSHLLYHLLLENDTVKAIHQKTSDINTVKKVFSYYTSDFENIFSKITWIEADLNNIPALKNAFESVIYVYHCAALVSFDSADYQKMRKINIDGTTNIVNFCISNSIKKLCFVSSVAAIEKDNSSLIDESKNWNNTLSKNGYAITKHGAEMEVWRASQEGVDVIIVNPGVILGSGYWQKGSGKIFKQIYNGFNFYTEGITGFVGVKDVVQIMQKLMLSDIKNERYILVSENVSFKEVFFQIADVFNKKRPRFKVVPFLSEMVWRLDTLKSFFFRTPALLTKSSAKSSQSKNYFSSQKIITSLPYQFESIEKSIQGVCKDFLM
ncbi:MAG: SDR family oxidoreductase [Flavobacteriaceae bacterium]|nr:SDR family oxidoreductase [Flavobacteriaceae bacterium]